MFLYTAQGMLVPVPMQIKSPIVEGFIGARSVIPSSESAKADSAVNENTQLNAGKCTFMNCYNCVYDPKILGGKLSCTCLDAKNKERAGLGAGLERCVEQNRDITLSSDYRFDCGF